ncbi:V-type ATP synthase subunit D [Streptomyces heilongjiangensis]|uniref:V-type ATP synthase subunit D n=1 Tax=Streptomyces heilongjiangensis TaxID=945052 RepID=A0ABW1BD29_9ACTN|nr:V-type ATP synthase subunit D [Streptomyces heilongjiangensis]MDC2948864.1 V-type ATP synthase subunit D [Streptomyces heilongjiangensis]
MNGGRRTPPGRAGRLRLRHSLDVAERGADLLEQKLRVLRAEHQRLLRAEREAARAWRDLLAEAEGWLLRGLLLGGEQALDSAAAGIGAAEVTVDWATSMGVRHPTAATVSVPGRPPTAAAPGNTALAHAEAAYGRAVRAAAAYAAARTAAASVGAEVAGTRHRVRALRRHWIPRLSEALDRSDLALEQAEHEDGVRRRWAAGH